MQLPSTACPEAICSGDLADKRDKPFQQSTSMCHVGTDQPAYLHLTNAIRSLLVQSKTLVSLTAAFSQGLLQVPFDFVSFWSEE